LRGHTDRLLGILLGVVLGVAIVAAFVFLGSRSTIDSPSIDNQPPTTTTPVKSAPKQP
jgi:uncharacterized membrane protein required for colicin V production